MTPLPPPQQAFPGTAPVPVSTHPDFPRRRGTAGIQPHFSQPLTSPIAAKAQLQTEQHFTKLSPKRARSPAVNTRKCPSFPGLSSATHRGHTVLDTAPVHRRLFALALALLQCGPPKRSTTEFHRCESSRHPAVTVLHTCPLTVAKAQATCFPALLFGSWRSSYCLVLQASQKADPITVECNGQNSPYVMPFSKGGDGLSIDAFTRHQARRV